MRCSQQDSSRKKFAGELEVVSISSLEKRAVLKLANSARNGIHYYGHSDANGLASPFFDVDEFVDGKWSAMGIGRCGTGTSFHKVARKGETKFQVFWRSEKATAIRVRLTCYAKPESDAPKAEIVSEPIPVGGRRPQSQ